jgi:hypothetical protein
MLAESKNLAWNITVVVVLVSNTLLPCFGRSPITLSRSSSSSANAQPIPKRTSATSEITAHTTTRAAAYAGGLAKRSSSIKSSTGKHSVRQQVSPSDSPSPPPLGPFKSIFFEGDSLQFQAVTGGSYAHSNHKWIGAYRCRNQEGRNQTHLGRKSRWEATWPPLFPDGGTAAHAGTALNLHIVRKLLE